jgi:hypothetical protein
VNGINEAEDFRTRPFTAKPKLLLCGNARNVDHNCSTVGLLGCWAVGLLGCWAAGLSPTWADLCTKSGSVSPHSGRMIVAPQFTAGMRSGRIVVREADGWNGSRQIAAVFSRPFHGLHLACLPSQRFNRWAIFIRPLRGLLKRFSTRSHKRQAHGPPSATRCNAFARFQSPSVRISERAPGRVQVVEFPQPGYRDRPVRPVRRRR